MLRRALAAVAVALTLVPAAAAMPLREPEAFPAYASDAGSCGGGFRRTPPPTCITPAAP